jgi:hypothetical protein
MRGYLVDLRKGFDDEDGGGRRIGVGGGEGSSGGGVGGCSGRGYREFGQPETVDCLVANILKAQIVATIYPAHGTIPVADHPLPRYVVVLRAGLTGEALAELRGE